MPTIKCPMTRTRCEETFENAGEQKCKAHGRVWINADDLQCPVLEDTDRCNKKIPVKEDPVVKNTVIGTCSTHGEFPINTEIWGDEIR